jgi:hypothetical protein
MAASGTSAIVLQVGLELTAVAVFTLIAGSSDDAGSIVVLFMIGLWIIYMVSNAGVISGISNAITNISNQE